jgi:hypothetical protein
MPIWGANLAFQESRYTEAKCDYDLKLAYRTEGTLSRCIPFHCKVDDI